MNIPIMILWGPVNGGTLSTVGLNTTWPVVKLMMRAATTTNNPIANVVQNCMLISTIYEEQTYQEEQRATATERTRKAICQ
jgi:hypothetical protein